jgi:hypothetical protein
MVKDMDCREHLLTGGFGLAGAQVSRKPRVGAA